MKRPWDAIAWWEIRRALFNLLILVIGLVSGSIVTFAGSRLLGPGTSFGSPFIGIILYGLAANLCYTLGWITELLWGWGDTAQTERIRPKVFRVGLFFSACLTLIPAIAIPLMWAIQSRR
jgi:hypothetical protein